jgi:lysophospholipase L1-like esterase
LGHGYVFILAAKYGATYPERNLLFINRGISGNRLADLRNRWKKDTLDLQPDVLSILVGINDVGAFVEKRPGASDAREFERAYDQLLKDTIAARPKVKIILCEPFVFKGSRTQGAWDEWQRDTESRRQGLGRLAAKYKVPLVRFQKIFDDACQRAPQEYWIWDGVHPTAAGHQLMADEWIRVYQKFYGTGAD